ncbi:MAG: hypothetical protein GEV07_19535 [Streptosporangiales bacterium]|nr:hypothetical protein [Streptosporangiales bacterium]
MSWQPPHEVDDSGIEELLHGGYDLHVHAAPDVRPRRMDVVDLVEHYRAAGMAGALLKDHFLPTVGRGYVLEKWYDDFRCIASCALNTPSGGLNPVHVEAALAAGVQWVFPPTVTSAWFVEHAADPAETAWLLPRGAAALTVLDDAGELLPAVHDVLDVLDGRDVVLASGHLSPPETQALFAEASRRGIERRVVTHASIGFIAMPVELQRELAADGALIEHCYVSCLFHEPIELARIKHDIDAVGASSCYLASDLGQPHNPAPVDGLAAALGGLQALGMPKDDLRQVIAGTPGRLVESLPGR